MSFRDRHDGKTGLPNQGNFLESRGRFDRGQGYGGGKRAHGGKIDLDPFFPVVFFNVCVAFANAFCDPYDRFVSAGMVDQREIPLAD